MKSDPPTMSHILSFCNIYYVVIDLLLSGQGVERKRRRRKRTLHWETHHMSRYIVCISPFHNEMIIE